MIYTAVTPKLIRTSQLDRRLHLAPVGKFFALCCSRHELRHARQIVLTIGSRRQRERICDNARANRKNTPYFRPARKRRRHLARSAIIIRLGRRRRSAALRDAGLMKSASRLGRKTQNQRVHAWKDVRDNADEPAVDSRPKDGRSEIRAPRPRGRYRRHN